MKNKVQKILYRVRGLKYISTQNGLGINVSMVFVWLMFIKYYITNGKSDSPLKLIEKKIYDQLNDIIIFDGILVLKPGKFYEFRTLVYEYYDLILPYSSSFSNYNDKDLGEGTYEHKSVVVEDGDVVIDAGASFGLFTLFSILKRNAKKVIAFEPSHEALKYFNANIDLNKISQKVVVYNFALSFNSSELPFEFSTDNFGGGRNVFTASEKTEFIQTTSLDLILNECVNFIKADIEGFERYLLLGAYNTLKEYHPKIAICTYHYKCDADLLEGIIKLIDPNYIIHHASGKLYAN